MSENTFKSDNGALCVTSYAGPVNTLERTRTRLQFTISAYDQSAYTSIGFNEAVALYRALDRWISERSNK